jgi:hypothetical protein
VFVFLLNLALDEAYACVKHGVKRFTYFFWVWLLTGLGALLAAIHGYGDPIWHGMGPIERTLTCLGGALGVLTFTSLFWGVGTSLVNAICRVPGDLVQALCCKRPDLTKPKKQ